MQRNRGGVGVGDGESFKGAWRDATRDCDVM
jgi:hypothetical protein